MPGRTGQLTPRLRLLVAAAMAVLAAVAAVVVVRASAGGPGGPGPGDRQAAQNAMRRAALANPGLDPGTPLLGRPAPGFELTDQFGRRFSLAQFRGKVVLLAFVDSRCTTICPLTTASMTGAVSLLGPGAAGRVQLLGVDANPDAIAVSDVRAYSRAHQMMRSWKFLTGSLRRLSAVWRAYKVYVAASHGEVDHQPVIYLIDAQGRERVLYLTQMSYTSVAQQAQVIADGLARLLPGHPAPRRIVSLRYIRGISPGSTVSLPVIGGSGPPGPVRLGPGHPHLLVFAASWVSEVSPMRAGLRALAGYQREARKRGLPTAVVIDEVPTEPSGRAVPGLLAGPAGRAGGYQVAADRAGRLASGYGVTDLPWIELTGQDGRILFRQAGWLPAAELVARVARAQARAGAAG